MLWRQAHGLAQQRPSGSQGGGWVQRAAGHIKWGTQGVRAHGPVGGPGRRCVVATANSRSSLASPPPELHPDTSHVAPAAPLPRARPELSPQAADRQHPAVPHGSRLRT